jgi:acetyl-CoA carboxylase carboxyl transferase subunit alpha
MEQAAEALHLTASKMKALALIDQVIPEPPGGAHAQPQEMIRLLGDHIGEWLAHGRGDSVEEMLQKRHRKFRAMGQCLGVDG